MWVYAQDAARLAIAVTLLVAGASKLLSPRPLARSLGQTFGWARPVGVGAARTVAVVELLAAFLVASFWAPVAGLALAALVGAGIMAFAAVAMGRGTTAPCGCFGEVTGRPIGAWNLAAGAGLLAGGLLVLALPGLVTMPEPAAAPAELFLPLTALAALVIVIVRDRARLLAPFRRHFRPLPAGPEPLVQEVS